MEARSIGFQPGSILDDDPTSEVTVGIGDASIYEGNVGKPRAAKLAVTLSLPSTATATVGYTVTGAGATVGSDYKGRTSGTITFQPGQVRKVLGLAVLADLLSEGDEEVTVVLSAPSGATLLRSTGILTILDDEPVPPAE